MLGLRNSADYRSLLWVGLAVTCVAIQYAWPQLCFYVWPLTCYLATACGGIAHNHSHRPTFRNRRLNNAFGHVLTIFYGYPVLMWTPTHSMNHHRFSNRTGDASITWRYTNKHNLLVLLSYPFISGYFQSKPIQRYIQDAKQRKRGLYSRIIFQYVFWIGFYALMLVLAGALHHRERLGLPVWFLSLILPAICSATTIMIVNYLQHVHADAHSKFDHSRNFTGRIFNFLFFNVGYHTAHHANPSMHWAGLPAAHARIAHAIAPELNQRSVCWFMAKQYLLALIFPSLGTRQIGPSPRAAIDASSR